MSPGEGIRLPRYVGIFPPNSGLKEDIFYETFPLNPQMQMHLKGRLLVLRLVCVGEEQKKGPLIFIVIDLGGGIADDALVMQ